MDWRVNIIADQTFVDDDGIFEVISLPSHEGDQWVLSQSQLTLLHWWTIGQNFVGINCIPNLNDWTLVVVLTSVWTTELHQFVLIKWTIFATNADFATVNVLNRTRVLSNNGNTGVVGSLVFDTRTNQWCVWIDQRNRLTLHVGTHQGTVRVIVFQERNCGRGNGNNLLRRNVHVVNLVDRNFDVFLTLTSQNNIRSKWSIFVQNWVTLGNDEVIFFVGRQVVNLVRNLVRIPVNTTVWRLNESVTVNTTVRSQWVDQTDVRTFRRFDRVHTSVVRVVHVSDFITGTVTSQTTRSQGR